MHEMLVNLPHTKDTSLFCASYIDRTLTLTHLLVKKGKQHGPSPPVDQQSGCLHMRKQAKEDCDLQLNVGPRKDPIDILNYYSFLVSSRCGNPHLPVDIHDHNFIVHRLDDVFATLLIRDVSNKPPPPPDL